MHVIGHQHIGVHRTTEPTRELAQLTEIIPVVLLREETSAAVITSLDEVWHTGQRYPWTTRPK